MPRHFCAHMRAHRCRGRPPLLPSAAHRHVHTRTPASTRAPACTWPVSLGASVGPGRGRASTQWAPGRRDRVVFGSRPGQKYPQLPLLPPCCPPIRPGRPPTLSTHGPRSPREGAENRNPGPAILLGSAVDPWGPRLGTWRCLGRGLPSDSRVASGALGPAGVAARAHCGRPRVPGRGPGAREDGRGRGPGELWELRAGTDTSAPPPTRAPRPPALPRVRSPAPRRAASGPVTSGPARSRAPPGGRAQPGAGGPFNCAARGGGGGGGAHGRGWASHALPACVPGPWRMGGRRPRGSSRGASGAGAGGAGGAGAAGRGAGGLVAAGPGAAGGRPGGARADSGEARESEPRAGPGAPLGPRATAAPWRRPRSSITWMKRRRRTWSSCPWRPSASRWPTSRMCSATGPCTLTNSSSSPWTRTSGQWAVGACARGRVSAPVRARPGPWGILGL